LSYIGKAVKTEPYSQGTTLSRISQSVGQILACVDDVESQGLEKEMLKEGASEGQCGALPKRATAEPRLPKKRRLKSHLATSTSTDVTHHLAMIVIAVPVVMVVMMWAGGVCAVVIVPTIIVVVISAIVVRAVLNLRRHRAAMMFCERIASINAGWAVVAGAGVISAGLGCESRGQSRERESKHKYFHFRTSTI